MDPPVSLGRLERALLHVSKHHGIRPFIAAVTGVSIALSVAISVTAMVALRASREQMILTIVISASVPGLVAPVVASTLGRLLFALDSTSSQLHHLAQIDALTGVLNRRAFATEASAVVETVGDRRLLVAMIDVDDFKGVNDRHGHAAGDLVLIELARRLDAAVEGCGRVGRFGGDEFVVAIAAPAAGLDAIKARLTDACDLGDVVPGASASLGVFSSTTPVEVDEAMRQADRALYVCKGARERGPSERSGAPTGPNTWSTI